MNDHSAIEAATQRLQAALDALESSLDVQAEAGARETAMTNRLHTLDADRARLASELDQAAGRVRLLETANRDIARRLDVAMGAIRSVLVNEER